MIKNESSKDLFYLEHYPHPDSHFEDKRIMVQIRNERIVSAYLFDDSSDTKMSIVASWPSE